MEALARHPELSALVDEVFLEYRFDFDGKKMDSWWKFAKGLFSDSVGVAVRSRRDCDRTHMYFEPRSYFSSTCTVNIDDCILRAMP